MYEAITISFYTHTDRQSRRDSLNTNIFIIYMKYIRCNGKVMTFIQVSHKSKLASNSSGGLQ